MVARGRAVDSVAKLQLFFLSFAEQRFVFHNVVERAVLRFGFLFRHFIEGPTAEFHRRRVFFNGVGLGFERRRVSWTACYRQNRSGNMIANSEQTPFWNKRK